MTYYKAGDYNVICDRCGFKKKASECKKEWTGLFVCSPCFDIRNPQDFVRAVADDQPVPIARPEPTDTFIAPGDVTPTSLDGN